jgi:hypothetical protein
MQTRDHGTPAQQQAAALRYARTLLASGAHALPTGAAAALLNRRPQTLRHWASSGRGPMQPTRVHGRLAWPAAAILRQLGVDGAAVLARDLI